MPRQVSPLKAAYNQKHSNEGLFQGPRPLLDLTAGYSGVGVPASGVLAFAPGRVWGASPRPPRHTRQD